jgi:hypothetical protein
MRANLLHTQGENRVDGGCAAGWCDAGEKGAEGEGDDRAAENDGGTALDLVALGGGEAFLLSLRLEARLRLSEVRGLLPFAEKKRRMGAQDLWLR